MAAMVTGRPFHYDGAAMAIPWRVVDWPPGVPPFLAECRMTEFGSDPGASVPRALTAAGFDRGVRVGNPDALVTALRAAAELATPILVVSMPGAGAYAGAGWWQAVLSKAAETVPEAAMTAVLDCGERPGPVLAAVRAGVSDVLVDPMVEPLAQGSPERLAGLAAAAGVRLWQPPVPPLFDPDHDGGRHPRARLRDWLGAHSQASGG